MPRADEVTGAIHPAVGKMGTEMRTGRGRNRDPGADVPTHQFDAVDGVSFRLGS